MKTTLLSVLTAVFVIGCAHNEVAPPVIVSRPPEPPLAGDSLGGIRYPAIYKAYSVGRRIDPQNPRIMYESGTVFVREYSDSWNLHPLPATGVPRGPAVAPTNAAYSPLPITDELKLELNNQRQATKSVLEQAAQLGQAVNELALAAQKMAEQQRQVLRQLLTTDERLRVLEGQLRQSNSPPAGGKLSTNRNLMDW